jgi:hypothetical protein
LPARDRLLHPNAKHARVVGQVALQYLAAKINIAEAAFQRVGNGAATNTAFAIVEKRAAAAMGQFVLALEVMDKAALCDTGLGAQDR